MNNNRALAEHNNLDLDRIICDKIELNNHNYPMAKNNEFKRSFFMIVYDGTKSDFIKEVENGTIAATIEKCVLERMGRHTAAN